LVGWTEGSCRRGNKELQMRIVTRQDVESLISMPEVIATMEEVFAALTEEDAHVPGRTVLNLDGSENGVLFMPGYLPKSGGVGMKVVSVFPSNAARGVPTISAQIMLCNAETGEVSCILEGGYITALRTAATTAVATKHLARHDACHLGVFGAGVQARSQIEAHREVRSLERILIYDLDGEKAVALAKHFQMICGQSCTCSAANNPEALVTLSDVVITATTSQTPVFKGDSLRKGTHINAIGSYKPHVREVDDVTIRRSRIFVDSYEHALKESGDLIIPLKTGVIKESDILGELGELVLGRKKGREHPDEITFFKSVGLSVQDIAVAQRVLEKAIRGNVGLVV
jgi:ornithine cyclodeaminase/alanine dehydrogenase-like protein (mu-crystallin family)